MMYCDRPQTEWEAEFWANTLAGRMEDIERRAVSIGAYGVLASLDQVRARLRDERDRILFATN